MLIIVDVAYSIVQNAGEPISSVPGYGRDKDPNNLLGEITARLYFPTNRNFRLHKPNITVSASSFGDSYASNMLNSPTLVNSVLEPRSVTVKINELGFRDAEPIENARTFALGDSFTFGWHVNPEESWVKRLESSLSTPIYNLGIDDSSPKQELELLKFVLALRQPPIKIRNLLWMIYEGNDLEDNYDETAPSYDEAEVVVRGTVLANLKAFPANIKTESVITKFLNGELRFRYSEKNIDSTHMTIDGVTLVYPLYNSTRFGYKLFNQSVIEWMEQPRSYVTLHPNRPKLEKVFVEMGELARKFGFDVTVILAPTAGRLQGKYFDEFPTLSDKPYFLEFVGHLAVKENFRVIDLLSAMQPMADRQLLYFRDDEHWNEDGNRLVATLMSKLLPHP
jgi:hypothetical protein